MFDVAPSELIILGTVALLVIPPKDLPRAMRVAGYWVGKARGVARQFRSGFDEMIRESELHEMEKRWREENERIMREHPVAQMDQAMREIGSSIASADGPVALTPPPTIEGLPAPEAHGASEPASHAEAASDGKPVA
jgi:sec-independent protein translocase protein TatB